MNVKERILEAKKQKATGTSALSDFTPTTRRVIEQKVGKDVTVERHYFGRDLRAAIHANPKEGVVYAVSAGYGAREVFAVLDGQMKTTVTGKVPEGCKVEPQGTRFTEKLDSMSGKDGWAWFLIKKN